jgi:hypothetical protein
MPLTAGSLIWTTLHDTIKAQPGQLRAKTIFKFVNSSDKPVHILSAQPSCDCLTVRLAKNEFAAHQSGELEVEISLAAEGGSVDRTITVLTDQPVAPPTILTVTIETPVRFTVKPRFLFWDRDEDAREKSIDVTSVRPFEVVLTDVQSVNPVFATRIETTQPGNYRLYIKPKDTVKITQATIRLSLIDDGQPVVLAAIAAVR